MPDFEKYKSFDEVKCLWMKCGAVDYKICDMDFDCENCDFDKRMSSRLKTRGNVQEGIENVFDLVQHTASFSHPHYHFGSGLVARTFLANTYYLGLEPFIVKFIDRNSKLSYSSLGCNIGKGQPVLNIGNGWGKINVLSPFNFDFVEKLEISNIFLQDSHWFAIIETEKHEIMSNSINKRTYFEKLFEVREYLRNLMKIPEVGATMYDGGVVLDNWPEILGDNAYRDLLEKLFCYAL